MPRRLLQGSVRGIGLDRAGVTSYLHAKYGADQLAVADERFKGRMLGILDHTSFLVDVV